MDLISQATRVVTDSEKAFWEDKDAGVRVIPPIPCRDCGLVWDHAPNCASMWRIDDISTLKHGEIRHGKVWCAGCKEWIGKDSIHASIAIREAQEKE